MKFDVPIIWREPICHSEDCYICMTKVLGFGKSRKVIYANVPTAVSEGSSEYGKSSCNEFLMENERNVLSQAQLNDWIRDLE